MSGNPCSHISRMKGAITGLERLAREATSCEAMIPRANIISTSGSARSLSSADFTLSTVQSASIRLSSGNRKSNSPRASSEISFSKRLRIPSFNSQYPSRTTPIRTTGIFSWACGKAKLIKLNEMIIIQIQNLYLILFPPKYLVLYKKRLQN